ncbi:unnamed protein product [Brachionus calyciflorus]|uniref:polo kinase n=1 Tax=Brachionus calyciflorus TaxID=104777 RepID=A0A813RI00_9BILA|nr:unnamed protein product [Brachionus calyciflorus]
MSTSQSGRKEDIPIPDIVIDPSTGNRYMKGKFLGKGGFARCYELTEMNTKEIFAGKIVSKQLLTKQHQKEKMTQEIAIHRAVHHQHIVEFYSFFEDENNVYIILELCRRRSLMEMHKRRKAITEPETRYFMRQIVLACQYLHENKIIHRDLKLGNLFLNDDMELKIGDFGLATKVDFEGERKKTLCGTPNYIAPEVLNKKGHSYEVDVWSLGCILYTLLIGKPPFETSCLKDTYAKIKKNEYTIPPNKISTPAKNLINHLLQADPNLRPTMCQILQDEFFYSGLLPPRLPTTCLSMPPRFDRDNSMHPMSVNMMSSNGVCANNGMSGNGQMIMGNNMGSNGGIGSVSSALRKPLLEINDGKSAQTNGIEAVGVLTGLIGGRMDSRAQSAQVPGQAQGQQSSASAQRNRMVEMDNGQERHDEPPEDYYISDLYQQLSQVILAKPTEIEPLRIDDAEDPACVPMLWVSKWVDYSDKYGLGYQLCDESVGVLFNDSTRLILCSSGENLQYIERDGSEYLYTLQSYPDWLQKKITLLKYFRDYMSQHLLKAGASIAPRPGDEMSRLPFLRTWLRTRNAIILHLSNGTIQINFFHDHTKIIVCPIMGAVTYIDEKRDYRTFKFTLIEKHGCTKEVFTRLKYAKTIVERIMQSKISGRHKSTS